MNNKGFTLMETLAIIIIIGVIFTISIISVTGTLAISDDKSYEIVKNNIINISKTYILECENNMIDCIGDYEWNNNEISFRAYNLVKYGYFEGNELINPITKNDISNCLIINAKKNNGNLTIILDDSNC